MLTKGILCKMLPKKSVRFKKLISKKGEKNKWCWN